MFTLFFALFFLPLVSSDCPQNTIKWPDDPPFKCYSFINVLTSFEKAELACNNNGGHLTSIHEGWTNTFLRQGVENFTSSTTSDFWIGATKSADQGNWTWTDHTPFDFNEWQDSSSGACGAELLSTGRWNAHDCGQLKPYVCAFDDASTPTTSSLLTTTTTTVVTSQQPNCDHSWQYFDNSCYYWAPYSNWENGEAFCVKNNSHLVSIHSADEINFIKSIHNEDFWTGLYTNSSPIDWDSTWKYTDNFVVDYLQWIFPFYPSHNSYQCVRTSGANFANVECSTVFSVFCKKASNNAVVTTPPVITTPKPTGNCLNGWSYNSKTKFCYYITNPGNFTTLETYCERFAGGHLSSFKDADEFSYLNQLLYGASGTGTFWLGLYSDDGAISWKFVDGTPFDYRPWTGGYPVRDGSLCASSMDFYQQLTNQYACSGVYYGICKMPPLK